MFRFRLLATTAALALATGIAGAQELVIGADVDAGTLDPRLARDTTAYRTVNLIYSGLVHLTPDLEPVPDLAESWDSPDPNTIVRSRSVCRNASVTVGRPGRSCCPWSGAS